MTAHEQNTTEAVGDHEAVEDAPGAAGILDKIKTKMAAALLEARILFRVDTSKEIFERLETKYQQLTNREIFLEDHPNEELSDLRSQDYLSPEEIAKLVERLRENQQHEKGNLALQEALKHIGDETEILDRLDETIGRANLAGGLEKGEYSVSLRFGANLGGRGNAINTGKTILVDGDPPDALEMLQDLASYGDSEMVSMLHHELVHVMDDSERLTSGVPLPGEELVIPGLGIAVCLGVSLMTFRQGFNSPPGVDISAAIAGFGSIASLIKAFQKKTKEGELLTEAHAYRATSRVGRHATTLRLARHIFDHYGIRSERDLEKFIVASGSIQELQALDMSEQDIGAVLQKTTWDKDLQQWRGLREAVAEHCAKKGCSQEELEVFIADENLRREIERLKVKKICQSELQKINDGIPAASKT